MLRNKLTFIKRELSSSPNFSNALGVPRFHIFVFQNDKNKFRFSLFFGLGIRLLLIYSYVEKYWANFSVDDIFYILINSDVFILFTSRF